MTEQWRPVAEFHGHYEVTDLGRIRSMRSVPARVLRTRPNPDGYLIVTVSIEGKRFTRKLHRLVCAAFHGSPSVLHKEAAHLDGNRDNARASNLRWVSKVENRSHRKAHGTECSGERHGAAKLTDEAVREIRSIPKGAADLKALGKRLGVSWQTVSSIRSGKGWRHVRLNHQAHGEQG